MNSKRHLAVSCAWVSPEEITSVTRNEYVQRVFKLSGERHSSTPQRMLWIPLDRNFPIRGQKAQNTCPTDCPPGGLTHRHIFPGGCRRRRHGALTKPRRNNKSSLPRSTRLKEVIAPQKRAPSSPMRGNEMVCPTSKCG